MIFFAERLHDFLERSHDFFVVRVHVFFVERLHDFVFGGQVASFYLFERLQDFV